MKNKIIVEIEKIEIKSDFKYLWLYYITGINLDNHCQKSFKGKLSQKIKDYSKGYVADNIILDEKDTDYYYICGGSKPEIWENNFHLAFKKKEGCVIDIEEHGIKIRFNNAERISFSEKDIDKSYPHSDEEKYYTCRNWQFAHWLNNHNIF